MLSYISDDIRLISTFFYLHPTFTVHLFKKCFAKLKHSERVFQIYFSSKVKYVPPNPVRNISSVRLTKMVRNGLKMVPNGPKGFKLGPKWS